MRIEIEIPNEFESDYNANKFKDFFGRVITDATYNDGVCGLYELETAQMLKKAFAESKESYDVEAVVAELESIKTGGDCRHKCKHYDWSVGWCEGYCEDYVREKTIEIVRNGGKDVIRSCANCKHQPEPLTTCDWLKSQTVVFKECPRWEGKE